MSMHGRCPMSEEQQKVYNRVLDSDDYALLRKNSDPCPCGMKKSSVRNFQFGNTCLTYYLVWGGYD